MIQEVSGILTAGNDLSAGQMREVMEEILTGTAQTPQIVAFLTALSNKGETVEEISAAVEVMRGHVRSINTKQKIILDTCGTGGDRSGTFNISTCAAFVAAGSSVAVAKHGNRAVSSCCGSADILEALGVNINMPPLVTEKCLDEIGIAFLFAPVLHPAMKYAAAARKEIGKRTIFNILGPLSNPAGATHQLVGVYSRQWVEILARVLAHLGTLRAMVVHADNGLDEISTVVETSVCEVNKGLIRKYRINAEDFGFKKALAQDLCGGNAADNANIVSDILKGVAGPKRDIVVLNAAAAIFTADKARSIEEGIRLANQAIDSGRALEKLELLKQYSQQ